MVGCTIGESLALGTESEYGIYLPDMELESDGGVGEGVLEKGVTRL